MAEKITCPECGEEFDLGEGYKKHLEALEKKAVKDADKRNKEDYEKKLEQGRKKDKEISEAKVKAEKEKTDKPKIYSDLKTRFCFQKTNSVFII